jgi:hypothetical protein
MKRRTLKKRAARQEAAKRRQAKRDKDSHLCHDPHTYYQKLMGVKLPRAFFYEFQRTHFTYYYMT